MAKKEEEQGPVRIKPDLEKYVTGVSGSGKKTKRSDHPVSALLDGFTIEEVATVGQAMLDVPAKDLIAKYAHLNVGQQRMNIGNRIRGAVNKLDKANEEDKKVVAGLPTLKILCEKPRVAANKRDADFAKKKADRKAKAEANAKKKAADEKKAAAAAKGQSKAA